MGELHICVAEFKDKKIKSSIPANFIKDFSATIADHHKPLTAARDTMEKSACKDARLFSRRCPEDFLQQAEKELVESGKTLKAWRHLLHVYQNDASAKGKKKDKEK